MEERKRRKITKEERVAIHDKTNGKCSYCGIDLPQRWHVDHMEAFFRGGSEGIENLWASCISCNNYKHSFSLEQFRRALLHLPEVLNNAKGTYRIAKRFKLIEEKDIELKFYFETIQY